MLMFIGWTFVSLDSFLTYLNGGVYGVIRLCLGIELFRLLGKRFD